MRIAHMSLDVNVFVRTKLNKFSYTTRIKNIVSHGENEI
jgi:hypothetical protein